MPSSTLHQMISATVASDLIHVSKQEAERLNLAMAIAVVDTAGKPIAFLRMDDASVIAAETVVAKARAAAWMGRPTAEIIVDAQSFPTVYGSFLSAVSEPLVYSMGGIPLFGHDGLAGAIAASGGSGHQDIAVATAGAARFHDASA